VKPERSKTLGLQTVLLFGFAHPEQDQPNMATFFHDVVVDVVSSMTMIAAHQWPQSPFCSKLSGLAPFNHWRT
jgi:hypothetical protein